MLAAHVANHAFMSRTDGKPKSWIGRNVGVVDPAVGAERHRHRPTGQRRRASWIDTRLDPVFVGVSVGVLDTVAEAESGAGCDGGSKPPLTVMPDLTCAAAMRFSENRSARRGVPADHATNHWITGRPPGGRIVHRRRAAVRRRLPTANRCRPRASRGRTCWRRTRRRDGTRRTGRDDDRRLRVLATHGRTRSNGDGDEQRRRCRTPSPPSAESSPAGSSIPAPASRSSHPHSRAPTRSSATSIRPCKGRSSSPDGASARPCLTTPNQHINQLLDQGVMP